MLDHARNSLLGLAACVGLALAASQAPAQDAGRERPQDQQEARPERPILTGPQVRERRMPGVESGFSEGAQERSRAMNAILPPQVFRKVMGELMSEEAPVDIRLSAEQRERITVHVRAFEQVTRREARPGERTRQDTADRRDGRRSGPEGMESRRQRPQERARDQGEATADPDTPERSRGERRNRQGTQGDQRQTIRAMAQLQNRVWAELSASQQQHIKKAIETWQATQSEEQLDRMRERYRKDIGTRFDEMEGGRRPGVDRGRAQADLAPLEIWISSLPEDAQQRVRARLSQVSPERLAALVGRLEAMGPEARERLRERLSQSPQRGARPERR